MFSPRPRDRKNRPEPLRFNRIHQAPGKRWVSTYPHGGIWFSHYVSIPGERGKYFARVTPTGNQYTGGRRWGLTLVDAQTKEVWDLTDFDFYQRGVVKEFNGLLGDGALEVEDRVGGPYGPG